ncbi:MAG: SOS response-associated peptidase [Gammaproteobacteria bacterium]|nr:SOS response-associated peptidase [Gammaproteobacteria bacterium]
MCGRFTQAMSWKKLHSLYQMPRQAPLNLRPRYNGAPTQEFAACRLDARGVRAVAKLRWGLIPGWATDVKIGARMINARAETVHQRPAYRAAFKRRRCLIPVDGWFEWRTEGDGKQPWYITAAGGAPLSFAALWERWEKGDEPIETFTILTTGASASLAAIHHRQPSVLEATDFDTWLAPDTPQDRLLALARHSHEGPFENWRVSRRVNNSRNDAPDLLLPLNE